MIQEDFKKLVIDSTLPGALKAFLLLRYSTFTEEQRKWVIDNLG